MTAPARHNHVFHGLKKPEIAYLPTACAETLPFPPPTVLSCYRPYMGWQSWRFEGQTFESPHILVYDLVPREPLAHVLFRPPYSLVMAGLDPALTSWVEQSPDRARLEPRLSGN